MQPEHGVVSLRRSDEPRAVTAGPGAKNTRLHIANAPRTHSPTSPTTDPCPSPGPKASALRGKDGAAQVVHI